MGLIKVALRKINRDELIKLSRQSNPLAIAATAILKSKGAKEVEPRWFNPYEKALRRLEVRNILRKEAAQTFKQLEDENRIVPWVYRHKEVRDHVDLILEE